MILNRYVAAQIAVHITTVLLVIAIIDLMLSTLSEWTYALEGDYQAMDAFWYVLATSPSRLYDIFPIIALIGCLTGLGALANSSQITVMRATGISQTQIALKVLIPALVIMLGVTLVGETLVPKAEQFGQSFRSVKGQKSGGIRHGVWHREKNEFIFMAAVTPEGEIRGLTRYVMDENGRPIGQIKAEKAQFMGDHWQMHQVEEVLIAPKEGQALPTMSTQAQPVLGWQSNVTPDLLNILLVEPNRLPLGSLITYLGFLINEEVDTRKYQLAFWTKVLKPVMTLSLVLVAISFIFGPLREVATGTRVFVGVLVGVVIKMGQNLLAPASLVYGINPFIAAAIPIAFCTLLGLYLLRRS